MTSKPDGMIETYHLQELKDNTDIGKDIWGIFRELYGICYSSIGVDERTGEIYNKYD